MKNNFYIKENSWLAKCAALKLKSNSVAMVLGKTIHLHGASKAQFLANKKWVQHELCHVAQFKKYGFVNFILQYLWQSLRHGYHQNKFEIEARLAEEMPN